MNLKPTIVTKKLPDNPTIIKISLPLKTLVLCMTVIALMFLAILIAIGFTLNILLLTYTACDSNNFTDISVENNVTYQTLGDHYLLTKENWGGRESARIIPSLHHPTQYVLISHTAGRFCHNLKDCSANVQQIQAEHFVVFKGLDIGYNFLIGGDGNIYVGRGWDVRNSQKNNCIGISFIGNYVFDELTPKMVSALEELLNEGVELKKLSPNYLLVAHNQTTATLSPGVNTYKVISKLPNFSSEFVVLE